MKTGIILSFLILTCSFASQAQPGYGPLRNLTDSTRRAVELPLPQSYPDSTVVIKSTEEFNAYFKGHDLKKLTRIDFTTEYLELDYFCPWCSGHCNHAQGICHRNACGRNPFWVAVKKE